MRTCMTKAKLRIIRLRTDRLFHERIMAQYRWKRRGYPLTPSMIFAEKKMGRFTLGTNFRLTFAFQVLVRQTFFWKYAARSIENQVSTTPAHNLFGYALLLQKRQWFSRGRLSPNTLSLRRPREARSAQKAGGAIPPFSTFSPAGPWPTTSLPGDGGSLLIEYRHHWKRNLLGVDARPQVLSFTAMSSAKRVPRNEAGQRLLEWVARRYSPIQVILTSRDDTLLGAGAGTPTFCSTPRKRQQGGLAAAEETREFIFQKTQRVEHEIDDLKLTIQRTEDQVSERVVRRLKEVVKEQLPVIDVGGLSLQIYRNLERMIRTERERRGM
jgi:hypothetical protein